MNDTQLKDEVKKDDFNGHYATRRTNMKWNGHLHWRGISIWTRQSGFVPFPAIVINGLNGELSIWWLWTIIDISLTKYDWKK